MLLFFRYSNQWHGIMGHVNLFNGHDDNIKGRVGWTAADETSTGKMVYFYSNKDRNITHGKEEHIDNVFVRFGDILIYDSSTGRFFRDLQYLKDR